MEPLDSISYRFSAFARREDGTLTAFDVAIACPRVDSDGISGCKVYIPFLRAKPFEIFGIDDDQALELSHRFILSMTEAQDFEVVDEDGVPVALPPLS